MVTIGVLEVGCLLVMKWFEVMEVKYVAEFGEVKFGCNL